MVFLNREPDAAQGREARGMRRIIYASQATADLSGDDLTMLLQLSRSNNESAGLTGMLLYSCQSFLQVLEGDDVALESTYGRIRRDDRHQNFRLLMDVQTQVLLFPTWTMGFEHVDGDELVEGLDGFAAAGRYPLINPDLISDAGVAEALLRRYTADRVR